MNHSENGNEKNQSKKKYGIAFIGIGSEIIAFLLLGVWFGKHLDEKFQLRGLATALSVLSGLTLWIIHLVYLLKKMNRPSE
ncbi:MAG: AtpZ/AtpI family protein [Bdellovibrionales bacterium]|nr:AtpZ/AtpI family protein [Bdellovibrionales bacterium]